MRYFVEGRVLIKNEKERGKLKKPPAWTINIDEFPVEKLIMDIDEVRYYTEIAVYTISRQLLVDKGYPQPKGRGKKQERKLIVPLQYWERKVLNGS